MHCFYVTALSSSYSRHSDVVKDMRLDTNISTRNLPQNDEKRRVRSLSMTTVTQLTAPAAS